MKVSTIHVVTLPPSVFWYLNGLKFKQLVWVSGQKPQFLVGTSYQEYKASWKLHVFCSWVQSVKGHSSQHFSVPVHIRSEQKVVEMCFYNSLCISKGYKVGQVFSGPNVINPRQVNKFLQSVLHSWHDFQFSISINFTFFARSLLYIETFYSFPWLSKRSTKSQRWQGQF